MTKLKIALISPVWIRVPPESYGGIEIIVSLLAEGLVERGHDVTLFASGDSKTTANLMSVYSEPQTTRIGQLLPELFHVGAAYDHIKQRKFDIVHDHTLAGVVLGGYSAVPTLVTLHGAFNEHTSPFFERFKDSVYYNAISEYQRQALPDLRYVKTVYNTISFAAYPVKSQKSGYLLFLSRFSPQKGAHVAIDVAKKLNKPLVLAGKIDPVDMDYFKAEIEPRIDGRQIRFVGEVSEAAKRELMGDAACFVFPIQWAEPFGLVMIEAMACGTPVVAYDNGSAREVITPGKSGYVAESFDELVEMVDKASLIDPAECRRQAETRFPVARMVDGYIDNYLHIIKAEERVAQSLSFAQPK